MGVKNLWDILETCKKTLPLHHLQNKRVCVDLSCWMVQLQNVNRSHCPLKDKLYLKSLFHRLRALLALNCSLIFVTDGSIPGIKLSTYRRRLNTGNEAMPIVHAKHTSENVSSLKRNMGSEFSCMIKEAKLLGIALGIQCLDGIEEAEAQCALLNAESLCDGCFTSDSDAFLFGARTVYRDICLGEGGYVTCYEMDDIERELGFGRDSLITLAILLGSDYTQGIRGVGPEHACQLVRAAGDSSVLQRLASEGLSFAKKPKNSKKKGKITEGENKENYDDNKRDFNGNESDFPMDNQFLQVINAYMKPKCHSADSDAVNRALASYQVNNNQLHQICAQYFDWTPEKTDEYILPKIAERNLRRFANLRVTSSKLDLHPPINEIPVKCPISRIIKQRKIQGRDYFEVSWEDMDGVEASVVPADLVQSACPEKIMEFRELKAQKQKPSRKPRQKQKRDTKELDRKLQQLVDEIEKESTTSNAIGETKIDAPTSRQKTVDIEEIDGKLQELIIDTEKESSGSGSSNPRGGMLQQQRMMHFGSSIGGCSAAAEVIDLISPLPPRRCPVSKPRDCVEVIELSDTENDATPQHARKMVRDQVSTAYDDYLYKKSDNCASKSSVILL
ncbi:single-strand DNA endonuclease 1 [Salvia hispanica]|uniref:single-strand DNA endonuclease 1 n=1 Tax=Salvia hispanica TaxID=49212 RepID=UPI0020099717|nr:single-strand DNA endonuclease 1 [Salvia hispanica]